MKKILCFDQSTRLTGYSLFYDTGLVRWGVIDCHKDENGEVRIKVMADHIKDIIDEVKPDFVVIEEVQLQNSAKALIMLAKLQGAINYYCDLKNIPHKSYYPTQWRKIVGFEQGPGHTRADLKQQAINFVYDAYHLKVSDDCAESISIGLAWMKDENMLPDLKELKIKKEKKRNGKKEKRD